jgi:hypothetical protein
MQRIGRVDRRRSRETEDALLRDHPQSPEERNTIYFWNFLPPSDLEQLLSLYQKVSRKTLRISKTLGREGKQLLTPDDDYKALQDFNASYEGAESREEEMALEYQRLMAENPGYEESTKTMPQKIYSGKTGETKKGFFFCYELPARDSDGSWAVPGKGFCKWYFVDPANPGGEGAAISEYTYDIWGLIRCGKETARALSVTNDEFAVIRKTIESHINRSYMKAIQAPAGVKPRLLTWMELA